MKRISNVIKIVTVVMAIAGTIAFLLPQNDACAQDTRVIRIWGRAEPIIEPPTLLISKGTTAVWFNNAKAEVKIIFEEGKKCDDVTDAPSAFSMDASNCYVTTWLPFGATSSLRFNEPGTYEYVVEYSGRQKKDKGKIIVE